MDVLGVLVEDERVNAALAWPIVGAIALAALASVRAGSAVWAALGASILVLALVPTVIRWDALVMLPWELLAVAAAPLWLQLLGLVPVAGFLTVATIALLATVELDAYTPVEMTTRFAVVFVVLATMAVAGVWVITQWAADTLVGTTHLAGVAGVMWDLVYATAFGGFAAAVFVGYFFRHDAAGGALRDDVGERESGTGTAADRDQAGELS